MRARALAAAWLLVACTPPALHVDRSAGPSEQYLLGEARLVAGESVFHLLQRTRPILLLSRDVALEGRMGLDDPIGVYVDGHFVGGLDALEHIPASEVLSVRRFRGIAAANRFAGRHRDGALDVRLLRQ